MNELKRALIELTLKSGALQFGEFTLKSGRVSPYFFNAGMLYEGEDLNAVGKYYAQTILNANISFAHLFGPAYKGLPLATSTAIALSNMRTNVTVTFNRKETKDHGEKGNLIGAPLSGNTIIIDDVITAGTAYREAKQQIEHAGGNVTAVVILLDRCEKGLNHQSTLTEIENDGISVHALLTFHDLVDYLKRFGCAEHLSAMLSYHKTYGTDN